MGLLTINLDVASSNQDILDGLKLGKLDSRFALGRLAAFIEGLNKAKGVKATVMVGGTQAISTVTFTGAPTAAQTMTVNGVTFTARASGAVANEFNIGPTVTETAASLRDAINASTSAGIAGLVRATSAAGVVTIYAVVPRAGTQGLAATSIGVMSNVSTSGAFASGADISNSYRLDVGRA